MCSWFSRDKSLWDLRGVGVFTPACLGQAVCGRRGSQWRSDGRASYKVAFPGKPLKAQGSMLKTNHSIHRNHLPAEVRSDASTADIRRLISRSTHPDLGQVPSNPKGRVARSGVGTRQRSAPAETVCSWQTGASVPPQNTSFLLAICRPGGSSGAAAPDPIPNSAVKRSSAYDTSSQDAGKSVAARSANRKISLTSQHTTTNQTPT